MKWQTKVFLFSLFAVPMAVGAQSATDNRGLAKKTQVRSYWSDPATGLMWTAKDNGKNVSWKKAMKYCRDLRLGGHSDWRLPNMAELQGTYDKATDAPGLAGRDLETTWHVKGNLFLTGYQWSSNYRMDDRGHPIGYAYYFDFNEGKPDNDPGGYSQFKRALCVRRTGE